MQTRSTGGPHRQICAPRNHLVPAVRGVNSFFVPVVTRTRVFSTLPMGLEDRPCICPPGGWASGLCMPQRISACSMTLVLGAVVSVSATLNLIVPCYSTDRDLPTFAVGCVPRAPLPRLLCAVRLAPARDKDSCFCLCGACVCLCVRMLKFPQLLPAHGERRHAMIDTPLSAGHPCQQGGCGRSYQQFSIQCYEPLQTGTGLM